MVNVALKEFPYLEYSSMDVLLFLCEFMIKVEFMSEKKATPIRSAFEFLREVGAVELSKIKAAGGTAPIMFAERDFVFAIKLFGLYVRNHNGINQFVPDGEQDSTDETVVIDSSTEAKRLEYYVSDVQKRTKIQIHAIESAANRLRREWREIELARIFSESIKSGKTIGQARNFLREECGIKDHEFVRIREYAISRGWFSSKRRSSKANRRVTLDDDVAIYVADLAKNFSKGAKSLTMSQATNKALRDFKTIVEDQEVEPVKGKR
jgi:hypothetical protein